MGLMSELHRCVWDFVSTDLLALQGVLSFPVINYIDLSWIEIFDGAQIVKFSVTGGSISDMTS